MTIPIGFRDKAGDNATLDPDHPKKGLSLNKPPAPEKQDASYPAPEEAEVGNICLQQFPPPVEELVSDLPMVSFHP
jgi:hypothetical protein